MSFRFTSSARVASNSRTNRLAGPRSMTRGMSSTGAASASLRECAGSVDSRSTASAGTRRARAIASVAATVVFPTPPFPPTKISRVSPMIAISAGPPVRLPDVTPRAAMPADFARSRRRDGGTNGRMPRVMRIRAATPFGSRGRSSTIIVARAFPIPRATPVNTSLSARRRRSQSGQRRPGGITRFTINPETAILADARASSPSRLSASDSGSGSSTQQKDVRRRSRSSSLVTWAWRPSSATSRSAASGRSRRAN
jgi:hypothetical protein